jgi:predicted ribosomally synthesized peptide with SipW-like signal peptide
MNRKILLSLGMIVFVAALSWGATGAFFSDSESSTGNTFTAGAIDLTVDSQQHYNKMVCTEVDDNIFLWQPEANFVPGPNHYPAPGMPCDGTWDMTNLGPTHKFFNFGDVKPGDEGENTISLHIDSNPAWACADVSLTKNDDVSTVDPETDAGDVAEDVNNMFDGELAQNLWFVAWPDVATTSGGVAGDNIWQGQALEPLYFAPGPAFNVLGGTTTLALADSTTLNGPLPGGATTYVGLAWCAGTMTVVGNNLVCNGATMGNVAQTDSMVGNITLRVEQHRNNPNFMCRPQETQPLVTRLTLAKAVLPPQVALDTDFTLTASSTQTLISGVEGNASVTSAVITPGVYALGEAGGPQGTLTRVWECSGNATPEVSNGDGTGSVTIAAGENVVCGITNTYPEPIN